MSRNQMSPTTANNHFKIKKLLPEEVRGRRCVHNCGLFPTLFSGESFDPSDGIENVIYLIERDSLGAAVLCNDPLQLNIIPFPSAQL